MRWLMLKLLAFYVRRLSPRWGGGCRFVPCCSAYAIGCVRRHGGVTGLRLTLARLLRCREGCPGGRDPVPEAKDEVRLALRGQLVRAHIC